MLTFAGKMQSKGPICVIPKNKWDSITQWLDQDQRREEKLLKEREYFNYMKQLSTQLVAGGITKKESALKRLAEKQKEGDKKKKILLEDYLRIKEYQKKDREKIIEKYEKETIIRRTPTFELTRALKHAEVLAERKKQLELKNVIRKNDKKIQEKEVNEWKLQYDKQNKLQDEEEERRRCKLNEVKSEIRKQFQSSRRKKQRDYNERIQQEKWDLFMINEEIQREEKIEKQKQIEEKRKNFDLLKKAAEDAKQKRKAEKALDREQYRLTLVIDNAKAAINRCIESNCVKNNKEKIDRNVNVLIRYLSKMQPKEPTDEAIIERAVNEQQSEYSRKLEEKQLRLKKYAESKINNYKEDMQRKKMNEDEESALKHLEMTEGHKNVEAMKYLSQKTREEHIMKKKHYGKELLNQAKEEEFMREKEKKLEVEYIQYSLSKQNDYFDEYADEVLNFAKDKKWPLEPINQAIRNYKKSQPMLQLKKRQNATIREGTISNCLCVEK